MQTKNYQCPFCGDGAFIGDPWPGYTKHVCQHCKGTANTAPTPPNLAETVPDAAPEPTLTQARQVPENEAIAQALENLANHWNRMGRMIEADRAASTIYEIGKVDAMDDCQNDLRSLMERFSLVPASGATAHIEPSLSDKLCEPQGGEEPGC